MSTYSIDAAGRQIVSMEPEPGMPARHPDPVQMSRATILGTFRGALYVELDGSEYALTGSAESPADLSTGLDDIILSEPVHAEDNGRRLEIGRKYRLGTPVQTGTYARLSAPKAASSKPVRPVDALGVLPALRATQSTIVQLGAPPARDLAPLAGERDADLEHLHQLQPRVNATMTSGRPAAQGVEDIIARLKAKGVTLELTSTHRVVAKAPGGRLVGELRQAIDAAAPLIAGYLAGEPVLCDLPHQGKAPAAVTVACGGAYLCAQHLSGEL